MVRRLLTRIEQASWLDRVTDPLQGAVRSALRPRRLRDALHGVWLGHPLHPATVQVPIGMWMSAAVLDMVPGQRRAATTLLTLGTASAVPATVIGLNDWAALAREQRRVGMIHAMANAVGLTFFAGSISERSRGRYDSGRVLSYLGLAAAAVGSFVGGHLAYRQAAQVNQAAPQLRHIQDGWRTVAELADLPEARLATREIDGVPVLVYRDGDKATVMLEHCAHETGPLGRGELIYIDGSACVVCPWHGSTYRLADGTVMHGPSANDQQLLSSRVTAGVLEARLP